MRRWLIRNSVKVVLNASAGLARVQGAGQPFAVGLLRRWGSLTGRARGVEVSTDPATLGETWQRAFPAKKHVPIVRVDETTAYGEIHTPCPLRGSGDLDACYRMMAYDRGFMSHANARFVVLRSQAEAGVTVCEVAMRDRALPHDDLIPAHERRVTGG